MSYCGTEVVDLLSQVDHEQFGLVTVALLNNFVSGTLIPKAEETIDAYVAVRGHTAVEGTLRHFNPHSAKTVTMDGNGKDVLFLPPRYVPWLGLSGVTVDGVAVTLSNMKVSDQFIQYESGSFNSGKQNVTLTGSYGYVTVPHTIQLITAQLCANVLTDMVRRRMVPDIFARIRGGQASIDMDFGMLFAMPTVFTKSMRAELDPYRVYWVDVG